MKNIILLVIFGLSSSAVFAQDAGTGSFSSRKEKRMAEREKQVEITQSLLKNRDFVLEADYLQNGFNGRHYVYSGINFIAVNSNTAVIQTGSNYGLGSNMVGGVTAKGIFSNWKLSENQKQKIFNLSFDVTTNIGNYHLEFMISPENDYTTAMLTGIRPGQLTFIGKNLVPYNESTVFEGQTS